MVDISIPLTHFPAKKSPIVEMDILRELDEKDIMLVQSGACPPKNTSSITVKMRDRHHWIARLVAQGNDKVEISALTGMSLSRLDILADDPAFLELVSHYRAESKEYYIDTLKRISHLAGHAVEELQERLENSPEEFSIKDLMKLSTDLLDRTGFGPQQKLQVATVDIVAYLKELKARNATESNTNIISREGAIDGEVSKGS